MLYCSASRPPYLMHPTEDPFSGIKIWDLDQLLTYGDPDRPPNRVLHWFSTKNYTKVNRSWRCLQIWQPWPPLKASTMRCTLSHESVDACCTSRFAHLSHELQPFDDPDRPPNRLLHWFFTIDYTKDNRFLKFLQILLPEHKKKRPQYNSKRPPWYAHWITNRWTPSSYTRHDSP